MKKKHLAALLICGFSQSTAFAIGTTAQAAAIDVQQNILSNHPNIPSTAISFFAPIGYGPNWGAIYGSVSGVNRWPGGTKSDGSALIGAGLGNSDQYVGGSLNFLVDSLGLRDERFAQNNLLSGALTRWLTPNTSIAVGASNIFGSGAFNNTSYGLYAAGTHLIPLTPNASFATPIAVTVGFGSGNFISPSEMRVNKRDANVDAFGSLSVSPIEQLTVIGDYTAQVLTCGVSVLPIKTIPLVATAYATNIAGGHVLPGPVTYGLRIGVGFVFA